MSGVQTPPAATSLGPVKQIETDLLSIGYVEAGDEDGAPVLLLHGWPYDINAFGEVTPALADAGYHVFVPHVRGYGTTRFLADSTFRNGQTAALGLDCIAFMDALGIASAILAGFDWGARTANVVSILYPERCRAQVSVSGYLVAAQDAGKQPLPPAIEHQWWYLYYFATERGKLGYARFTHEYNKLIWQLASPRWLFDDATFDRSAAAFDNPDHVDVVIHNYRWRLAVVDGERRYDDLENELAKGLPITVPTITMEGDANGAPHAPPSAYASMFTGRYEHRDIAGGVGHNLPQEAPEAFTQAIVDVDRMAEG